MKLEEYLSFVYKGKVSESPFQYETLHPAAYYQEQKEALEEELLQHFFYWMYGERVKLSLRLAFLDYHLEKYLGEPIDFWEFVCNSPSEPIPPDADPFTVLANRAYNKEQSHYIEPKAQWLQTRKEHAFQQHASLGKPDVRITGRLSNQEVKEYFFSKFMPAHAKPILTEEEVWHFLRANFAGFKPRQEARLLHTSVPQITITRILREFFLQHSTKSTQAQVYCKLLQDNFSTYGNMTLKSISSSFSTCLN